MVTGCIEVMIMHPLDLIKTRFQLQNSSLAGAGPQYTGVRDCARKMYAQVTMDNISTMKTNYNKITLF